MLKRIPVTSALLCAGGAAVAGVLSAQIVSAGIVVGSFFLVRPQGRELLRST
jgi:hypothetical protein